jgi:hypothetical protein
MSATSQAVQTVIAAADWGQSAARSRKLGEVEITWDAWQAIPRYPRQRGTARHAAKLTSSGVLALPLEVHRLVDAVIVGPIEESAALFEAHGAEVLTLANVTKINGHSRTQAQREGHAPKPRTVLVTLHAARDDAEAERLYQSFDSQTASKNTSDKGVSLLSALEIVPQSTALASGSNLVRAVTLADCVLHEGQLVPRQRARRKGAAADDESMTVQQALDELVPALLMARPFRDALIALDAMSLDSKNMTTTAPALAAYLLMLRSYPTEAREFLGLLNAAGGRVENDRADAVYIARTADAKAISKRQKGGRRTAFVVCSILNAFSGWMKGADEFDAGNYPASPAVLRRYYEPAAEAPAADQADDRTTRSTWSAAESAGVRV